jgi:hypothetical protein
MGVFRFELLLLYPAEINSQIYFLGRFENQRVGLGALNEIKIHQNEPEQTDLKLKTATYKKKIAN